MITMMKIMLKIKIVTNIEKYLKNRFCENNYSSQ